MAKVELPPGYEFLPTDNELVLFYLLPRVTKNPLPVQGLIQDYDLYGNKHPWEIFEEQKSEVTAYFFTMLKKKSPKAKVVIRTVGDKKNGGGKWKLQAKGTDLKDDKGRIIGKKRCLSYVCEGKCGYGMETGRWTMKEYALNGFLSGFALPEFRDIVLCQIKNHQDNQRKGDDETEFGATSGTVYDQEPPNIQPIAMDMPMDDDVYAPTIDSGITQEQQQDDLFWQGNNRFARNGGYDRSREPNMEGCGAFCNESPFNVDPFFIDDGFGVEDVQVEMQQEQAHEDDNLEAFSQLLFDQIEKEDAPEPDSVNHMMPLSVENQVLMQPEQQPYEITNQMMLLPVQNQGSIRPEIAHTGDIAQESDIEHQVPTQQEQAFDLDYFLGISLDDLEDSQWMNGLVDPGGPLYVDGFESIYMPDVHEITDDKKDQSRKRSFAFDREDDEVQVNNKKIRQEEEEDEEAEDG